MNNMSVLFEQANNDWLERLNKHLEYKKLSPIDIEADDRFCVLKHPELGGKPEILTSNNWMIFDGDGTFSTDIYIQSISDHKLLMAISYWNDADCKTCFDLRTVTEIFNFADFVYFLKEHLNIDLNEQP